MATSSRTFIFDSAQEFDRNFEETFYSTDDSDSNLSSTDTSSSSSSSDRDSDSDEDPDNGFYRSHPVGSEHELRPTNTAPPTSGDGGRRLNHLDLSVNTQQPLDGGSALTSSTSLTHYQTPMSPGGLILPGTSTPTPSTRKPRRHRSKRRRHRRRRRASDASSSSLASSEVNNNRSYYLNSNTSVNSGFGAASSQQPVTPVATFPPLAVVPPQTTASTTTNVESGTQRFVRALSRGVVSGSAAIWSAASALTGATASSAGDSDTDDHSRHHKRRNTKPTSRTEEYRQKFNFLARRARRERDGSVSESKRGSSADGSGTGIGHNDRDDADDEDGEQQPPHGRTGYYKKSDDDDEGAIEEEAEEEEEVVIVNNATVPENSIFIAPAAKQTASNSNSGEHRVHSEGVDSEPTRYNFDASEAANPYQIPGVNSHEYNSTQAFPILPSTENPSNDSADVVIEEPVRTKHTRSRRRDKSRSNGEDNESGSISSAAPRRRRKAKKRSKSHRRYSASMASAAAARRRAGWEPGVDIRTTDVILQSIGSCVTIVDYNGTRYRVVQTEVFPEHHPDADDEEDANSSNATSGSSTVPPAPPAPVFSKWWQQTPPAGMPAAAAQATTQKLFVPPAPHYEQNGDFYYHLDNRPEWSSVRWISINGLSWEAISAISKRYQLHRLAIEDMVDIPQRTKVDMYPTHTFCVLPMHKLISYKPDDSSEQAKRRIWFSRNSDSTEGSGSKSLYSVKSNVSGISKKRGRRSGRRSFNMGSDDDSDSSTSTIDKPLSSLIAEMPTNTIYDWNNPYVASLNKPVYIEKKRPLAAYRRAVGVEQVSLFLTDQQTVISFFEHSAADIERPLLARLSTKSTMLRESCDPSMLLQAIMDIIVDQVQPIITAYRRRLTELEVDAMVTPSMSHTQDLHLMAAELSLLRNNIVPITSLIQSLRDHTQPSSQPPPSISLMPPTNNEVGPRESVTSPPSVTDAAAITTEDAGVALTSNSTGSSASTLPNDDNSYFGNSRISAVAKVYLADVSDHLLSYTQDLDLMRSNTKNMIDMIFNTISIQSSDGVKQLSLVTVVFMPLSFWTGYFGMNFKNFSVLDNTPATYWKIAVPFSAAILVLVMISSFAELYRRTKRSVKKAWANHRRKVEKRLRKKAKKREVSIV